MSQFGWGQLREIYRRTGGYCHLCRKKLALKNYAQFGTRGAWEVEHSVPRALGGTNRRSNLLAACISCNRSKRDGSTRSMRRANGFGSAPLSLERRRSVRRQNAAAGALLGGFIGLVAGPAGSLIGSLIGGALGESAKVDPG